jgi:polygalacturonase
MQDRRDFIKTFSAGVIGVTIAPSLAFGQADAWVTEYPKILARIKPPTFKKKDFNVLKYGAKAGGEVDNREAINRAINAANKAGGGRVVVPAGVFLTGAIRLKSNVNLHV